MSGEMESPEIAWPVLLVGQEGYIMFVPQDDANWAVEENDVFFNEYEGWDLLGRRLQLSR